MVDRLKGTHRGVGLPGPTGRLGIGGRAAPAEPDKQKDDTVRVRDAEEAPSGK